LDQALNQLFSYGNQSLDRLAFQKALDDIGANESAGADFSLQVLTGQFERACSCSRKMSFPGAARKGFKIIQPQLAASVAGELKSPDHIAGHALTAALFPEPDPARRETTPDTVKSLTIQDVQKYYQAAFRPDLTTILVIGKVAPENAVAVILKYFGGWKAGGRNPTRFSRPPRPMRFPSLMCRIPAVCRTRSLWPKPCRSRAPTRIITPCGWAISARRKLLCHPFIPGPPRKGRAGIFCLLHLERGPDPRCLSVEYGCDPPNVPKARAIILKNLKTCR